MFIDNIFMYNIIDIAKKPKYEQMLNCYTIYLFFEVQ